MKCRRATKKREKTKMKANAKKEKINENDLLVFLCLLLSVEYERHDVAINTKTRCVNYMLLGIIFFCK